MPNPRKTASSIIGYKIVKVNSPFPEEKCEIWKKMAKCDFIVEIE